MAGADGVAARAEKKNKWKAAVYGKQLLRNIANRLSVDFSQIA